MSSVVLVFGEKEYDFGELIKVAASGPEIAVELKDINDPSQADYKVDVKGDVTGIKERLVYFKQHGKFTILAGRHLYEQGQVKGRLISTPMLKRVRLVEEEVAPAQMQKLVEKFEKPVKPRVPRRVWPE